MPQNSPLYLPILQNTGQYSLAGGWRRFDHVVMEGAGYRDKVPADQLPPQILEKLTQPRSDIAGLNMGQPQVMGILNVTPDSFSDGGQFNGPKAAQDQAASMIKSGAGIIDIGGESTRPGADFVEIDAEITRTAPVISALRAVSETPISIDTRKSSVALAAIGAGANLINDVSAFTFDPGMGEVASQSNVPVCLMHAQGLPKTMQNKPSYQDVVRDIIGELEDRVSFAERQGVHRSKITIDPGIGFGKDMDHNLELLRHLVAFHVLGCPILLGASRKKFIGTLSGVTDPGARMPGSVAVALHGLAQGVQITRVHDVAETVQAFKLWMAING